jgi:SAM-dependent methyltransferase
MTVKITPPLLAKFNLLSDKQYATGKKLYGDDFTLEQIQEWYNDEKEGYADLGSKDESKYAYQYHEENKLYGFNKIKNMKFEHVLGFGSAWGHEFLPIIDKITKLTIVEASEQLRSKNIGGIVPHYVTPAISGKMEFQDETFDLITCFHVLHHIPNVSLVLNELIRTLKPNGYLLLSEPITSMGNWDMPRPGLTKHERGIPKIFFQQFFNKHQEIEIISRKFYHTGTSFLMKTLGRLLKKPLFCSKTYLLLDKCFSLIFLSNTQYYYSTKTLQKIRPGDVFYVIKKSLIS